MTIPRAIGGKIVTAAPTPTVKTAGVHTGAEARERALREAEAIQHAREVRAMGQDLVAYNRDRFRLPDPNNVKARKANDRSIPRYAADLIMLDHSWDDHYFIYEHQIYEPGNENIRAAVNYYMCAHEMQNCPVCPTQRTADGLPMTKGGYNMHTSVLDITEDTIYDGTVYQFRKRPLVIPSHLHTVFIGLFKEVMTKYGSLRGMMFLMERDGGYNSAIGRPVMRPDGAMYVMIPEEDLVADFGNEEERDDQGALIKPKNYDITPYDFKSIFPPLDQEYVRKLQERFGRPSGSLPPADNNRRRDWNENTSSNGATTPPPRVRSRSSYPASPPPGNHNGNTVGQTQDEVYDEAEEDDGNRAQPETQTSAATVPRVRSRAANASQTPSPPPTGQPVPPGGPTRTRVRPIGTSGTVQRAAGIDKDIPWTA